jgi:two-component system, NarL family, sensor histidine kinase BarA
MTSSMAPQVDDGTEKPLDDFPTRVELSSMLEPESFGEVIKTFSDLHRVGIKIFDSNNNPISDVRVGTGSYCGHLFEYPKTRKMCTQLVTSLKHDRFSSESGEEQPRIVNCFSGLRYVVLPLLYESDLVGRLVFGPFRPTEQPDLPEQLFQIESKLPQEKTRTLHEDIARMANHDVSRVLRQLQKTIEVILFSGYRSMLTSQMHIESVSASHRQLQKQNRHLAETNNKLQELDRMKSNFLATVSHELRTPLTSVIGYSEMLVEGIAGDLNEEQMEFVQTIMTKGESLLTLITQLLDITQLDMGTLKFSKSSYEISDVVNEAYTSVLPQYLKKNVQLTMKHDPDLPSLFGDSPKIVQIFVNLLGNSIKFTPDGGSVSIRASKYSRSREDPSSSQESQPEITGSALFDLPTEEFVLVQVTDTGIGFPEDQKEKIFDRFFQVDNSSTRQFGGAGLGLSIVKNILDAHRGEISVDSVVNQGSRFSVLLPVRV